MGSVKPAVHALERLLDGNERFRAEVARTFGAVRTKELLSTQRPFAVVLTCSDARVVPELIFDQTFGRLFVVRVAGNNPGPEELGSIEYGIARFGCRLVVVLGHTQCGAVAAAIRPSPDGVELPPINAASPAIGALVARIRPALEGALDQTDPAEAWRRGVELNVRSAVAQIVTGTPGLTDAVRSGVAVVGAVYEVETGIVTPLERSVGA